MKLLNLQKYWQMRKEKEMAGIKKIGQHEVTEIKRDAAQVGCTRVTRAEVEQLLKEMDSAPVYHEFTIEKVRSGSNYIKFSIRREEPGWNSASEDVNANYGAGLFNKTSSHFCLHLKDAHKLFEYLGGALGYHSFRKYSHDAEYLLKSI
jgi:hypothetical protein